MSLNDDAYEKIKADQRALQAAKKEEEDEKYERRHKFYVDFAERAAARVIAATLLGGTLGLLLGVAICWLAYVFL